MKLLTLPCAVGDTVYVLAECENIPLQLDGTLYGENGEPGTATGYYCPYEESGSVQSPQKNYEQQQAAPDEERD